MATKLQACADARGQTQHLRCWLRFLPLLSERCEFFGRARGGFEGEFFAMRRKKHKASRRAVKYYKIHFGFREPFKVRAARVWALSDVNCRAGTSKALACLRTWQRLAASACPRIAHFSSMWAARWRESVVRACASLTLLTLTTP